MALPDDVILLNKFVHSDKEHHFHMIKETDSQVSFIVRKKVSGSNKKTKKTWTKFLPVQTLTIKVKTVQGKKSINVFYFSPKSTASSKMKMDNISNSLTKINTHVFMFRSFNEQFYAALNRMLEKNRFEPVTELKDILGLTYPLFKDNLANQKMHTVSPFFTQIGRMENLDALITSLRFTDEELINYLKSSPLEMDTLFWISSLAFVQDDKTILEVLKNLPALDDSERKKQLKMIQSLHITPNQLRGMFSKVPSDVLIEQISRGEFTYDALCWNAEAWKKHYRTLRTKREPLTKLDKASVSEYILSHVYPSAVTKKSLKLEMEVLPQEKTSFRRAAKVLPEGLLTYRGCNVYQLLGITSEPDKLSHISGVTSEELPYFIKTAGLKKVFPGLYKKVQPLLFGDSEITQFLPSSVHVKYFFHLAERYFKERFGKDELTLKTLFTVLDKNISNHMTARAGYDPFNSALQKLFPENPQYMILTSLQLNVLIKLIKLDFDFITSLELCLQAEEKGDLLDMAIFDALADMPLELIRDYFDLKVSLPGVPAPF